MIIADTGFFLALFSRTDKHHVRALEAAQLLTEPLITTWPVLGETCHLLLDRAGSQIVQKFVRELGEGAFSVFEVPRQRYKDIPALMKKYQDLPMDLADASLVILAEFLEDGRILSTDVRDFKTYKWKNHKPFTNLLL